MEANVSAVENDFLQNDKNQEISTSKWISYKMGRQWTHVFVLPYNKQDTFSIADAI